MEETQKTVLATGGSGFIGSHFIRRLLNADPHVNVVNVDKLTYAGNPENLKDLESHPRYIFVQGDICDQEAMQRVFDTHMPSHVVNFAAESHVDRSIHGYAREFVDTNIYGVFTLLEIAKDASLEKFVQVSTDEVYGSLSLGSNDVFKENSPYAPRSPYAASKAAGDHLARSYFYTYGVPVIVTHSSNNYGSHQYPEKLIPFFTLRALHDKPLPLYGDGKNVRDWIHVYDNADALRRILEKGTVGEVYNIGGNNEMHNVDIAKRIISTLEKPASLIEYVTDRPGHDRRYAVDSSKIINELGWKPEYSFEEGLHETITWYQENTAWVEGAIQQLKDVNIHIDL